MVNNEVEIIKTVDTEKKDALVRRLVNAGISYLEKWEKVPFFKRREYNGSKEACVIIVNENQRERAQQILEELERGEGEVSRHKYKIKALMDGEKKDKGRSSAKEEEFFDEED